MLIKLFKQQIDRFNKTGYNTFRIFSKFHKTISSCFTV
ncbi:hypothetical protein Cst_c10500 [Thermoclostridium stercorarium subsp. stercorarium DSM 8532]|uniref:Uncharacterized protein n=1 Tax=Thermoclostridium stercorarium (strain ATCC 35414 / DSM 8532 / NCIMB 11754) TaxID=1121335 RepID=L7VR40_THES1|nr:hypothetical protein Cst_c10500 [Thermoclostridium stercorarium subsp. stercorarium DSM 8532]